MTSLITTQYHSAVKDQSSDHKWVMGTRDTDTDMHSWRADTKAGGKWKNDA